MPGEKVKSVQTSGEPWVWEQWVGGGVFTALLLFTGDGVKYEEDPCYFLVQMKLRAVRFKYIFLK